MMVVVAAEVPVVEEWMPVVLASEKRFQSRR